MKISKLQEKAFKAQCQINKAYKKLPELEKNFQTIEISFNILEKFLKIPFEEDDIFAVAIREIVFRSHKTLQAATLNATAGIEIPTMSLLRDLIETEFLLRYFVINPDEISEWWNADRKTRLRKYNPSKLREKIAKKFPKLKKPMEDDYIGHCEIAAHPTPISLKLQRESKNSSLFPPSKDIMFVWVCIMEVSLHAARVSEYVASLGSMLDSQSDFKEKITKLQKNTSTLDQKLASYVLHVKQTNAEKKYQTSTNKSAL